MNILSIDPGMSTGLVLASVTDDSFEILERLQVTGGLLSVVKAVGDLEEWYGFDRVVCEKFTPRPHAGGGFSLDQVEPLRIEGWLVGEGFMPEFPEGPVWRQPSQQYFCGGSTQPERRKNAKAFLKEHGLYVTGATVGQPDSEDVTSATLHLFGYLRDVRNPVVLERFFK